MHIHAGQQLELDHFYQDMDAQFIIIIIIVVLMNDFFLPCNMFLHC